MSLGSRCGEKEHSIAGVLCLEVSGSRKITFVVSEFKSFHTENFVLFPLCPPPP